MDERAAFEANIDANPLDYVNHLVYADWLDDHGESDEAAFRRSMGEWHKKRFDAGYTETPSEGEPWTADGVNNPSVYSGRLPLPEGINTHNFPPAHLSGRSWYYTYAVMQWPEYRAMEGDFRHAFMAGRRQQPEQLSRITRAVRKMRKR